KIVAAPRADAEIPVEHPERGARPHRPKRTTDAAGPRGEIAVPSIQHRNSAAAARGNGAQVDGRMPAWNDNDIRPCRGELSINRAHVGASETVRIEAAAQRRRRENP